MQTKVTPPVMSVYSVDATVVVGLFEISLISQFIPFVTESIVTDNCDERRSEPFGIFVTSNSTAKTLQFPEVAESSLCKVGTLSFAEPELQFVSALDDVVTLWIVPFCQSNNGSAITSCPYASVVAVAPNAISMLNVVDDVFVTRTASRSAKSSPKSMLNNCEPFAIRKISLVMFDCVQIICVPCTN